MQLPSPVLPAFQGQQNSPCLSTAARFSYHYAHHHYRRTRGTRARDSAAATAHHHTSPNRQRPAGAVCGRRRAFHLPSCVSICLPETHFLPFLPALSVTCSPAPTPLLPFTWTLPSYHSGPFHILGRSCCRTSTLLVSADTAVVSLRSPGDHRPLPLGSAWRQQRNGSTTPHRFGCNRDALIRQVCGTTKPPRPQHGTAHSLCYINASGWLRLAVCLANVLVMLHGKQVGVKDNKGVSIATLAPTQPPPTTYLPRGSQSERTSAFPKACHGNVRTDACVLHHSVVIAVSHRYPSSSKRLSKAISNLLPLEGLCQITERYRREQAKDDSGLERCTQQTKNDG